MDLQATQAISFHATQAFSFGPASPTSGCDASFEVGGELPHRVNNTYVCGVNPYTNHAVLEKCCQGPITNITSPAPTSGPYSDSWPVTCLAYCAILIKPFYDGIKDKKAHDDFIKCLGSEFHNVVCTEVNGLAPNECDIFTPTVGCTDGLSHSTWDGTTYVSSFVPVSTDAASQATTTGAKPQLTAGPTTTGTGDAAANNSNSTVTPSASPTKSSAQPMKPFSLTKIVGAVLALQALIFMPLL